jgi:hydroxyethylthiazole kinase-like uncharacterized protein yjeF
MSTSKPNSSRERIITQKQAAAFLKPRPHDSHKGMFGSVAIVGGASGMVGAALLAGRAALKLGAGCVHVGLLAENALAVDMAQPELMLHRVHASTDIPKADVYALGCGMGTSIPAQKILHDALRTRMPLVLDADALNLLARHADLQDDLRARKADSLITPHPGEAARLLGIDTSEVQADRPHAARQLAAKLHCAVALKGARTVCVTRNGDIYLNNTGNPGMSAPGMGDVLTGMIAALIAQGLDADQAMLLAIHLHGAAGDALAAEGVQVGMTASEVTDWARWLLNHWAAR